MFFPWIRIWDPDSDPDPYGEFPDPESGSVYRIRIRIISYSDPHNCAGLSILKNDKNSFTEKKFLSKTFFLTNYRKIMASEEIFIISWVL